jgi:hypothetical protein
MKCNICGQPTEPLFTARVLDRHEVSYFRCGRCGFMQTEEPFWLAEAYTEAVSVYDVWAVSRPLNDSARIARLLDRCGADRTVPGLDFGGGTGIFTRRMRDLGYPFLRADAYSANLYARFFDLTDHPHPAKFSLITCFEVFEHLPNPRKELAAMFELSDTVFFSTTLAPAGLKTAKDWDYFAPFHGQHVSFYTVAALQELAAATGSRLFTNGEDQHLLTRTNLRFTQPEFGEIVSGRPSSLFRRVLQKAGNALLRLARPAHWRPRDSLTYPDFGYVCEKRLGKSN